MNTKNAFSTLLAVLITAVIAGVLTGVISYSYAVSKKDIEIEDLKEQLSQAKEQASVESGSMSLDTSGTDNQEPTTDDRQTEETTIPTLTPEKTTENFYNWYINYPSDDTRGNVLSSGAYKTSPYVSEELVKNVEASIASFNGGSGYDPILCAQDKPNKITVGNANVSGKDATIDATEDFVGKPTLKIVLKLLNNQWKITSISCPNK